MMESLSHSTIFHHIPPINWTKRKPSSLASWMRAGEFVPWRINQCKNFQKKVSSSDFGELPTKNGPDWWCTLWWANSLQWKDPPFLMGKSTIDGHFPIAMLVHQRVHRIVLVVSVLPPTKAFFMVMSLWGLLYWGCCLIVPSATSISSMKRSRRDYVSNTRFWQYDSDKPWILLILMDESFLRGDVVVCGSSCVYCLALVILKTLIVAILGKETDKLKILGTRIQQCFSMHWWLNLMGCCFLHGSIPMTG